MAEDLTFRLPSGEPLSDWSVRPDSAGWLLEARSPRPVVWRIETTDSALVLWPLSGSGSVTAVAPASRRSFPVQSPSADSVAVGLALGRPVSKRTSPIGLLFSGILNDETSRWQDTVDAASPARLRLLSPAVHEPSAWLLTSPPGEWKRLVQEILAMGRYAAPWGLESALVDLNSDSLTLSPDLKHEAMKLLSKAARKGGLALVPCLPLDTDRPEPLLSAPATDAQVQAALTRLALSGSPLRLGDRFTEVTYRRLAQARRAWPTQEVLPVRLGPGESMQVLRLAHRPHCRIVALYAGAAPEERTVPAAALGLADTTAAWVFDLWNLQLMGPLVGGLTASIPAEGCRLFFLRPLADHPVFLCTDRHLTTAPDHEARWDSNRARLSGRLRALPGETRQVYVAVPPGWQPLGSQCDGSLAYWRRVGNLLILAVDAPGGKRSRTLEWTLEFEIREEITTL